jgi:cytochrome c biogenesis protein CcmG, thiol:disulfide interchange protein DsbE
MPDAVESGCYYRFVKRVFSFAVLAALLAAVACDRGARPAQIGKPAPDFTVQDSERRVHLADFRGQTVLLNFWASWCPPCIEEMPSLVAMQKQLGSRVTVVAVSIDEDEDAYRKFLRDRNVALLTVRDPDQTASRLYGTFGWPETYVIDPDGVIRRKFIGATNWLSPEIIDYLQKVSAANRPQSAAK